MRFTPRFLFAALGLAFAATTVRAHAPASDMLEAANAFIGSLSPPQKAAALYPLTSAQRETWYFIPITRAGLPFKQMTDAQHALALALLRSGLSQSGFVRTESIIALENVLKELENGAARRDPTHYYVTIFATPSATQSWGWRFEGHHLSLNFTVVDGSHVFITPSFFGTNPADVPSGPKKGLRVLGEEEDLGRAFMKSLDQAQRAAALISNQSPDEIFTSNRPRAEPLSPAGLTVAHLQPAQRDQLLALLKLYAARYRTEIADAAVADIMASGWEKVSFAWAGGLEPGMGHYYRIQGPTFVIEFDNTQNNANHIHTVWRDFKADFGRDPLAEHYAKEHAGR
jgi:Protein of unknown function (DUF3500)